MQKNYIKKKRENLNDFNVDDDDDDDENEHSDEEKINK